MFLDIEGNRKAQSWTWGEQASRLLWGIVYPLFRLSPRIFWIWRICILRLLGASIGPDVHIYPSARIFLPRKLSIGPNASIGDRAVLYNVAQISIGRGATVSQGAHLCAGTHDYKRVDLPPIKAPIVIGEGAWICAEAFIGPGVSVGDYAIVGARAVVMLDVASWTIVFGNPARKIGKRPRPETS
jgi:putative colanic acid biosynthesis acetyltransferase WcaF